MREYKNPSKKRNKGDTPEKVAHKVAWNAVKKKYTKRARPGEKRAATAAKNQNRNSGPGGLRSLDLRFRRPPRYPGYATGPNCHNIMLPYISRLIEIVMN
jgi:hypothetical protein